MLMTRNMMSSPAASRAATAGGTAPVASSTTMPASTPSASLAPIPEGHDLAADGVGLVHRQDLVAVEVGRQRRPGSSHQDRVAGGEHHFSGAELLAGALDGDHDQVAGFGDHPREGGLADEA
jgi:hypothetical protein